MFFYGTLQDKTVQLANFGPELVSEVEHMLGYSLSWAGITDAELVAASRRTRHPIVMPNNNSNDRVVGTVFQITKQELAAADDYEVADYKMVSVVLASGLTAWVYIQA